jgi:hypothetical protein
VNRNYILCLSFFSAIAPSDSPAPFVGFRSQSGIQIAKYYEETEDSFEKWKKLKINWAKFCNTDPSTGGKIFVLLKL